MKVEDCYVGQIVVGNEEASTRYCITVEGVLGCIDEILSREIRIKPLQSINEIYNQIIKTSEEKYRTALSAEQYWCKEFFEKGYIVNPKCFDPYEPTSNISLLSYLM